MLLVFWLKCQQDNRATLPYIHCITKISNLGGGGGERGTDTNQTRAEIVSTTLYFIFCPIYPYLQEKSRHYCTHLATLQCKLLRSPADNMFKVVIGTNRNNTVRLSSYARTSGIYDVHIYRKGCFPISCFPLLSLKYFMLLNIVIEKKKNKTKPQKPTYKSQ